MAGEKTREIRTWLLDEIKRGAFDRNTPLPGDLELADRFKVSRGTVRVVLDDLRRQGIVERRRGAGTFLSRRGERRTGIIGLLFPEIDCCEYFKDVEAELQRYGKRLGYSIESGRKRIAFDMVDCVAGKNENLDNRFFGVAGESVVFL